MSGGVLKFLAGLGRGFFMTLGAWLWLSWCGFPNTVAVAAATFAATIEAIALLASFLGQQEPPA